MQILHFGPYRPLAGPLELHGANLLLQPLESDEQHGHDEQQGERSYEHTSDGSRTERAVTVGTDADEKVAVYTAGCFDPDKVTVAESYTISQTDKDNLRMRGIVFKDAAAAN